MSRSLVDLPDDTVFLAFEYLERKDLFVISQLSKRWEISRLARSDRIWKPIYEIYTNQTCNSEECPFLHSMLTSKERKGMGSESFFERYKHEIVLKGENCELVFSDQIKCWVLKNKEYVLQDKSIFKKDKDVETLKVVVMGAGTVGKTCLLIRFCHNKYREKYIPTIFDNKVARVKFQNELVAFNLWDTSGNVDYGHDRCTSFFFCDVDVFIFCYDTFSPESLNNIRDRFVKEGLKYSPTAGIVLCANKVDLVEDRQFRETLMKKQNDELDASSVNEKLRRIPIKEGLSIARQINAHVFMETSAKSGYNLHDEEKEGFTPAIIYAHLMRSCKPRTEKKYDNNQKCTLM